MKKEPLMYVLELTEREAQVLAALTMDVLDWEDVPEAQAIHEALDSVGAVDAFGVDLPHCVYGTLFETVRE